jgi:hypothetical protein
MLASADSEMKLHRACAATWREQEGRPASKRRKTELAADVKRGEGCKNGTKQPRGRKRSVTSDEDEAVSSDESEDQGSQDLQYSEHDETATAAKNVPDAGTSATEASLNRVRFKMVSLLCLAHGLWAAAHRCARDERTGQT